jgi:hypothetical protein
MDYSLWSDSLDWLEGVWIFVCSLCKELGIFIKGVVIFRIWDLLI